MSLPPGASYRVFNMMVVAKRHLLQLEEPVRIEFNTCWEAGNPLFDWFGRWSSHLISRIQLRKEHEGPFFHEYVAFELRNQGGYFRIDRRQLPDEHVPLDSLYTSVEAYDTIEQIGSLDDRSYTGSDCLVEVEFCDGIDLARILSICRAIHRHPHAAVYTLQRYNCYFFAQTILLCLTRSTFKQDNFELPKYKLGSLRRHVKIHAGSAKRMSGFSGADHMDIRRGEDLIHKNLAQVPVSDTDAMLREVLWAWDEKKRLMDVRKNTLRHHYNHRSHRASGIWGKTSSNHSLASLAYRRFQDVKILEILEQAHKKLLEERLKAFNSVMSIKVHAQVSFKRMLQIRRGRRSRAENYLLDSTYQDMQDFVGMLVFAHGVRVEQYTFWLRSSAAEVTRDIKAAMQDAVVETEFLTAGHMASKMAQFRSSQTESDDDDYFERCWGDEEWSHHESELE